MNSQWHQRRYTDSGRRGTQAQRCDCQRPERYESTWENPGTEGKIQSTHYYHGTTRLNIAGDTEELSLLLDIWILSHASQWMGHYNHWTSRAAFKRWIGWYNLGIRVGNRWLVLWYFFNSRDGKYGTYRVRRAHRTLWMNYG